MTENNQIKRPEILAPAGSRQAFAAAVNAGADAVYLGADRFGARAYAANFDRESLLETLDDAHLRGVKVHLTLNTLLKEEEIAEVPAFLAPYYEAGLDAVLIQDFGVFRMVRREFPLLPIHASTQMTVTGAAGLRLLKKLGAARVVLARELSLSEIRSLTALEDIPEIETFIHGAMCYSYSGQCLLSSLIGGRSGNRGRCAQPCRLPYRLDGEEKASHYLSLRDMNTIDILPDLIESGIASLKIEGRMKDPGYNREVVRIYRQAADRYVSLRSLGLSEKEAKEAYQVPSEDRDILAHLYVRTESGTGYYYSRNGRSMLCLESPAYQSGLAESGAEDIQDELRPVPVNGEVTLEAGKPAILRVSCHDTVSEAASEEAVAPARSQPLSADAIRRQIEKTGASSFTFSGLDVHAGSDVFLPVRALNELRRKALSDLKEQLLAPYRREAVKGGSGAQKHFLPAEADMFFTAAVTTGEQLRAVLTEGGFRRVYLPHTLFVSEAEAKELVSRCHNSGAQAFLALPYVLRPDDEVAFEELICRAVSAGTDGFLVRSFEEAAFLLERKEKLPPHTAFLIDSSLYTWNMESRLFFAALGFSLVTAPVELNRHEMRQRGLSGSEVSFYGRLALMTSAQCPHAASCGCDKQILFTELTDRKGQVFPVRNHCDFCYNLLYNSVPLYLGADAAFLKESGAASLRLSFTDEKEEDVRDVIRLCKAAVSGGGEKPPFAYTRAHMTRKVL